jgi:glycosyltransferase involved in cell wall biosynthesis
MHVLVVARWYPSHDAPSRGSFVADQVDGLLAAGLDVTVASWEQAVVRGTDTERREREIAALSAWRRAVRAPRALNLPIGWGSPGVPVARLPSLDDANHRSAADSIDRHRQMLLPFALALSGRHRIDVVHAHTGLPDGAAASAVADALGVPLVVTEHSSTAESELATDPSALGPYRSLDAPGRQLVGVSRSLAGRVAAAAGLPIDRFTVVPNAVPIERFALAETDGRDRDELLWVGNRTEAKGMATLLQAFALVRTGRPALRLRLIGGAPTAAIDLGWKELAAELAIGQAVMFEPVAGRATVAGAMARAWIFVHPSQSETFGMVAAEALATGLPVAATPSGGVDEILGSSGDFGEVASGPTAVDLAAAVERLLDRRPQLDPAAMRAHVARSFSPPVITARLVEIYDSLVSAGAPRGEIATPDLAPVQPPPSDDELPRDAPILVVALNRTLLDRRLRRFPVDRLSGHLVVTTRPTSQAEPAAPGLAPIELDPDGPFRTAFAAVPGPGLAWLPQKVRRIASALIAPRHALARRRLVRDKAALRQHSVRAAIAAAWRDMPGAGAIVACDAEDVDAVADALANGARLAPGGLRWLADRLTSD